MAHLWIDVFEAHNVVTGFASRFEFKIEKVWSVGSQRADQDWHEADDQGLLSNDCCLSHSSPRILWPPRRLAAQLV